MSLNLGSVCIATHRRAPLLERLLRSLDAQELGADLALEIVLVDNDAAGSARAVAEEYARSGRWPLRYSVQPVRNIALTRNAAVAGARGGLIYFIDDDEVAAPGWAASLHRTLLATGADGVFGPVFPRFHDQTPSWMRSREYFFGPVRPTGAAADQTYTNNALVKADWLRSEPGPFDPRYGITGGEDAHLFSRLLLRGARFVSCSEAIVEELVPPERTTLRYLFLRGLKGGNTHTRRAIELAERGRLGLRLRMIGKAVSFGSAAALLTALSSPSPRFRAKWLIRIASNLGRLRAAFGSYCPAYRGRPGS